MLTSEYNLWRNAKGMEYKPSQWLCRLIQQDHPEVEVVKRAGNYAEGYRVLSWRSAVLMNFRSNFWKSSYRIMSWGKCDN
jgi:hypothetical protein